MPRVAPWIFSLVATLGATNGCSEASLTSSPSPLEESDGSATEDGDSGLPKSDDASAPANVRVVAANVSSGAGSNYDSGEGIRLLRGLKPDVALLQEVKYGANTDADARAFVTAAFGAEYNYFRESGGEIDIPNAVVSRFPITESGHWTDPKTATRGFAYAKIAVPGPHPLWAISVHLLTSNANARNDEAAALTAQLKSVAADGDYIVIGGDFNTDNRSEACLGTFGAIVAIAGKPPADQSGNEFTNAPRNRPYDWLLPDPKLAAKQVATVVGAHRFANGLVFDSRVYTPLADVPPVKESDSAAENMQHMPVVKDFHLP